MRLRGIRSRPLLLALMTALALVGCGAAKPTTRAELFAAAPTGDRPAASARAESIVEPAPPPPPAAPVAPVAAAGQPGEPNRLVSADGSLNVQVGNYSDCSGRSPISARQADIDPCFPGRWYFVGHSPGAFSPLLRMRAGALITWFDANGTANRLRVVAIRDFARNSGVLSLAQPDVVAQFQTCLTADGSLDRILDAVRA